MLALGFGLVSVVLVAITVEMMVVGPLGDPDAGLPRWLGLGEAYTVVWSVLRWPTLLALVVAFLMCLYRFTPNVRQSWRDVLPGAVGGAALWILAALIFRLTAPLGMRPTVASDDPTVVLIGQSVNAVVATVLWAYLASAAILLGGEANALLRRRHDTEAAQPRVQSWVGRMLVDADGWSVGTVDHVLLDRDTGESRWMAVMTGKFGTRLTIVPIADAWEGPEGGIRIPFTRGQVLAAPRAGAHGPPTHAETRRLIEHYAARRAQHANGNGSAGCAGDPFAACRVVHAAPDEDAAAHQP